MICSSAFWTQKCENLKSFNPYRPTLSLARGTNRQFYCTGVMSYNKLDNYFFVSSDRQAFLGFKMTANLSNDISLREQDHLLLLLFFFSIIQCVHFRN